ncbi:MAG TPA: HEAT repeat domain-containing protein [Ignavibacteriaceae bacterium]|nr:HEAT repeat domain-containing protein [Ignavibacteriaceae bacterium]
MKLTLTILLLLIIAITTTDLSAKPRVKAKITDNTVASLMEGLNSENLGLKSSSAYMIGELQLSKALIPLLKILHEDENEEMRIAAALALYKIGSPIAIQAVKQSIRFDDSERVSKLCASFYSEYLKSKLIGEEINVDVAKTALK